ncbi:MAG: insulinase family protein [Bdellovibrionales bacterium]|nr:insulinase family protein [Bdellovibrionales bacterium]
MKILMSVLILTSLFLFTSCATTGPKYELHKFEEVKLPNGMNIIFIPDNKLPSVSMVMMVKTGSASDPKGRAGLANLVAGLLDKGTTEKSALEIADSLGQVGAEIGSSARSDFTLISGSSLSTHSSVLYNNLADIVMTPAFRAKEFRRYKAQVLSGIQKSSEDPSGFAGRAFSKYLYGSHPYAHPSMGTEKGVSKIKRKDVIRFYKKYYRPNNTLLAVVGDYTPKDVESIKKKFSSWTSRSVEPLKYNAPPQIEGRNLALVYKPGLAQSQIVMGHLGIRRKDPDYVTLKVANSILGLGFSSRLVSEIRSKRGLTYSIHSYFIPRWDRGPFTISTFSRNEKVGETVKQSLRVFEDFYKSGVTKEEVEDAKAYLKGMFPRILETPESTAENLLILRYYDVPDTYLTTFLDKIDKISVSDVNKAIKDHFDPMNMKVLVYSQKSVNNQLQGIGDLQVINYQSEQIQ